MEIHDAEITFDKTLTLVPISDVHLGARGCDEKAFDRTIRTILETPDCYTWIIGDLVDGIFKKDARFDGTVPRSDMMDMLDSMLNAQVRHAFNKLKPLAEQNKLIGIGAGNHEYTIRKESSFDITMELCERLNVKNLGYSSFMRLRLVRPSTTAKRNLFIYSHHGYGGGRKPGSSLNKLKDLVSSYHADIYATGHDHQKLATKDVRLRMNHSGTPKLVKEQIVLVKSGTYLRTVERGDTGYGERGGYPPVDIGSPKIMIEMYGREKELVMRTEE